MEDSDFLDKYMEFPLNFKTVLENHGMTQQILTESRFQVNFCQTHGIVAEVCLASTTSLQDNGFDKLVVCGGHVDIVVGQLYSTTFLDLFY